MVDIWKDSNNKIIEMTVGIPVMNVIENSALIVLESLKNQKNINFGWELIIWEEMNNVVNNKKESYANIIKNYIEDFPNCQRIYYKICNKNLTLLERYVQMSKVSDKMSKIFVLQNINVYSSPNRLYLHYENFKNKNCYISTQFMELYYNTNTKEKMFYYGINKEKIKSNFFTQNHINFAVFTKDIMKIKNKYFNNDLSLENYIKIFIGKIHNINYLSDKYIFTDYDIDKNNWKYSLHIDNINNINQERAITYKNPSGVYIPYNRNVLLHYTNIENYIPKKIIDKLEKCGDNKNISSNN